MAAFNGFNGLVPAPNIDVWGALLQVVGDDYVAPIHADEAGIHRVSLDFLVWNDTEG
jgi:hypothetical protein